MEKRPATADQTTIVSNMVFAFVIGSILQIGKKVTESA